MLIGIDLDEVLSCFVRSFLIHYNQKHGTDFREEDFRSYDFEDTIGGNLESTILERNDFFGSPEFDSITPVAGSIESVDSLSQSHGLYVVTSRVSELKDRTLDWLDRYYRNKFRDVILTGDAVHAGKCTKPEICMNLGVELFVEDNLKYAKSFIDSGMEVLLLDRPWNRSGDVGVRVYNWGEIVEYVQWSETRS